jgi:hypothetical protein
MAEPLQEKVIVSDASDSTVDANVELPPPEKASAIRTRRIIIFAFWTVVATLGLPHWIWTTSIYRSELPVEQMTQWAEGHVGVLVDVPVCCFVLTWRWSGLSTSISRSCGFRVSEHASGDLAKCGCENRSYSQA